MGLARALLLAASENLWLKERACRWAFVRRAVSRFMPGESVADAISAAQSLGPHGLGTILTCLGENVTTAAEAERVADHYVDVLDRIDAAGIDSQISVKPTQLGLDLSVDACVANVARIAVHARARRNMVWIDMESTPYVDRTLDLFRRLRADTGNVGICLQAYLRRTEADVDALLPIAPAIRLVKGAYREPPELAFPKKRDVDENYFRLATRLLAATHARPGTFLGIATHDLALIDRIASDPGTAAPPASASEIEMLYGIRAAEQRRLAAAGRRVRVLISYGTSWFPWYMRRLAERPANVIFVAKSLFGTRVT